MKNRTIQRLTSVTSVILALLMALSVFPALSLVSAADDDPPQIPVSDVRDFDAHFDDDAADVASAAQLESALAAEEGVIRVTADFQIDRTFYVTADTVIFSSEARVLTRAADFAGDLFVVGERSDGSACSETVRLSLGDPRSETSDLFVIDGNKANLTVDVTGSALFIVNGMKADLYKNVTIRNCAKSGNVKTSQKEDYGVSYPAKIGGSAVIVCKSALLNVLGSCFAANEVNNYLSDNENSSQGGAIYNFGLLNVYGGRFDGNHGGRGGAIFNYRTMRIYRAEIVNNTSNDAGGAVYMPNSTGAYAYLGGENDRVESGVLIDGNVSGSYGGGIYANNFLSVKDTTFSNNENTANTGGALFCGGVRLTVEDSVFEGNRAANNAGAIYGSASSEILIDNVDFIENSVGGKGGAITLTGASTAVLNEVTGLRNTSVSHGGFLYSDTSCVCTVYHSVFTENASSTKAGGAFYLNDGAITSVYASSFTGNSAGTNGGAIGVYSNGAETVVQNCTFTGNHANEGFGGAVHVSTKGVLKLYSVEARNNSAKQGGFMYETVTNSSVTIGGLTVAGNTASDGGPIIWGNSTGAKLYLDKGKYTDEDLTGEYDDAYWSAAIVNLLTVAYQTVVIPSYIDFDGTEVVPEEPTVDRNVRSSAELERALLAGLPTVVIAADFELNRTFYIPYEVTIVSEQAHTLTRAANFAGDLFVIGEASDGISSEAPASLTVGDPTSQTPDLLIIDGNRDNMTVDVTGTVFYVVTDSMLRLYPNATVRNCLKVGNAKTEENGYGVSYPEKVGGSVAILTNKSYLDMFGGRIVGNGVNTESTSEGDVCFQGGAIYNFGTMNVYGGSFENNSAKSGGAIFNYRRLHIYNGSLTGNAASDSGGAVYMANSGSAYTYIGEESELAPGGSVLFGNNTAGRYGGAVYARNFISAANAVFNGNVSTTLSGGAISAFNIKMTLDGCVFENNSSGNYGGALYFNGGNEDPDEPEATVVDCTFIGNASTGNGGAVYMTGTRFKAVGLTFEENESGESGGAVYLTGSTLDVNGAAFTDNSAVSCGGGIYPNTDSTVTLNNINATGNSAASGGFLYTKNSELSLYNSTVGGNTAVTGGAVCIQSATDTKIYNTVFENNSSTANAGAIAAYSNESPILLHTCVFRGNSAPEGFGGAIHVTSKGNLTAYNVTASGNSAKQGGFMYETLSGSVVTVVGLTVSGNSASEGGPIIWGNTFNAVLNIDKSKYEDGDVPAPYDGDYWAQAIKNKLTVNDVSGEIPTYLDYGNEPYDNMSDAVDVSSAEELEAAINAGVPHIRIVTDFNIDRTFYISGQTTIFSTIEHTLTRDPAFGGEIFVVGETADGRSALLLSGGNKLVLGNPLSVKENLLVIDGNDGNMTVDVVGSVIFVVNSGRVEFYPNLTVRNCYKTGNEKSFGEDYRLGTPQRTGGAVGVISTGVVDIFGGNYLNNRVNAEAPIDEETGETPICASNGGAFYNGGHLRIYGGNFENNEGARGGLIYSIRVVRVYGGTFKGNHALTSGGAIYAPSVSASHAVIGTRTGNNKAIFEDNYSDGNGGCFQISALAAFVIYGNAEFRGNHAQGGGAICAYGSLSIFDTYFHDNYSASRGGAIYLSNQKEEEVTREVTIVDSTFENNVSPRGGAISVFASSADYPEGGVASVYNCTFTGNRASSPTGTVTTLNGGAIHLDRKGSITVENSVFIDNSSEDEAGALYATGKSKVVLKDVSFTGSQSTGNAGAVSLRSSSLYMDNVVFEGSVSGGNGGAVYVSYSSAWDVNSDLKAVGCSFIDNSCEGNGAAVYATRQTVENDARILDFRSSTFRGNSAKKAGGAMYVVTNVRGYFADDVFENNSALTDGGAISTYGVIEMDSLSFTGNTAEKTGGAVAIQSSAETSVYSTIFTNNTAGTNGGAVVATTGGSEALLHSCTFAENTADLGGGVYATGSSVVKMYAASGCGNVAGKGGFLYVTTTGTTFTLAGAEVSGNSASEGGPIIWGNSTGAVLNVDKAKWTDSDEPGAYDEAYWAAAIVNKLTVNEVTESIPEHTPYSGSGDVPPVVKPTPAVVPVTDVFNLSQNSSDGYIDSVYDKFERLDNSSNFMSTAVKVFENINGSDVTVDSYVYHTNTTTENMSVGVGLMIYQAMRYKEAHPDEEVYIDVSAYRFSVQTGVNINRNSRYFGYVRQMMTGEYDQFGFVRISYLLVSAAKMGVHVNAIGHLDAYPMNGLNMVEYFASHENDPCDPAYVSEGKVGDYLKFTFCNWTLDGKGGTDMMHTKLCAVSHYLDMNGTEHRNAVWTSSANLDGTTPKGYNANWKLQTATIISDHEEIYRASVNYLRLIASYCAQEEIYIFQDLVNERNTVQAQLLSEGRGNEIPQDEQIIYLGTPEDDVFELYFAPFGGGIMAWDELCNPYAKYIRKLYDSEGYIRFAESVAEYSRSSSLQRSIEDMVAEAFHKNRNPENALYIVADEYPAEAFGDLTVGTDIGFKYFHDNNKYAPFDYVHNKDILMTYTENGERFYVSILNSLNVHSGSMYYQSNQVVVIKEKTCASDSIYSVMAKGFTTAPMTTHTYGEQQIYTSEDPSEHSYVYRVCTCCGEVEIERLIHREGGWETVKAATVGQKGIEACRCTACGLVMKSRETEYDFANEVKVRALVENGAAYLPEDAADRIDLLFIPANATNLEAVFTPDVSIGALVLEGTEIDGASLQKIAEETPITVFVNRLRDGGGAAEALESLDGVTTRDILGVEGQAIHATVSDRNTVRIIGKIVVDDCDFDNVTLRAVFSREGYEDKSFEATISKVFKTVRDAASTSRATAAAQSLFWIDDAEYIYALNVNGVPDGTYSLNVTVTGAVHGVPVIGGGFETVITTPGENEPEELSGERFIDYFEEGAGYTPGTTALRAGSFASAPKTFEAVYTLPLDYTDRAGVLFGTYTGGSEDQINVEAYTYGQIRLWIKSGGTTYTTLFDSDVRSADPRHLALTVDGRTAKLYLDGELKEAKTISVDLPELTENFCVAGDNRAGNAQGFKGVLYGANIFSDVRSPAEIAVDAVMVTSDSDHLLYSEYFPA